MACPGLVRICDIIVTFPRPADFAIAKPDLAIARSECLQENRNNDPIRVGSIPGHLVINRDREGTDSNLILDYFSYNPRFSDRQFHRRYRMSHNLFLRIVDEVKGHDMYFVQQANAMGRFGLSTLQKITAVFRMLAYGLPADATDEYVKIGESTAFESLKRFCRAVVEDFGEQYLRSPTPNDVAGFCTPVVVDPQQLFLKLADYDLWIWHAYFGIPGTNNDINVSESSQLFSDLAAGSEAGTSDYQFGACP
ncbi:PREDICTED: uncharacterized protein LOC109218136 [Nicotiana attenuata]|uniref:uncharacterized protein LOC109218136 n=1 Tax=Nicotiana attenuata TaxID=49451 RepID=UPI0009058FCF|nr:PREDICTED: uncharacterized protein LOC109218136 [Nicotiana attenuata]